MESKLTKQELLEQLTEQELVDQLKAIEKRVNDIKDERFFQKFNGMSFFQVWKNAVRWKIVILLWFIYTVVALLLSPEPETRLILLVATPILLLLITLSPVNEVYNKIKSMKKKKGL